MSNSIILSSESERKEECVKEYTEYINTHIANVNKAWKNQVSKLTDDFIKENYNEISKLIKDHDLSKYGDEEFPAYRANYFPVDEDEKKNNESDYEKAWEHHYKNNIHHWQHWLNKDNDLLPIEDLNLVKEAYIEMICDWQGMGYVFGNTANQYYKENKDTIKLYPELLGWVEGLLQQLDDKFIKGGVKLNYERHS